VSGVLTTGAAADPPSAVALIGPVPTTATSHPFNASTVDLASHGYVEEEFFLRGTANVYDYDAAGNVVVTRSGAPYANRIIVRRPADRRHVSGTVVVELMNMTNRWDLDRMWLTSHDRYLRAGDIYIGVTSAPTTVDVLKKFDPQRYAGLSWADPAPLDQRCTGTALNSTPTTEGGLIWDIFTQVGAALIPRSGQPIARPGRPQGLRHRLLPVRQLPDPLHQRPSACTRLRRLPHRRGRRRPPPLGKCSAPIPAADPRNIVRPTAQPVIRVQTQTDYYSDGGYSRRSDADTRTDRYRLYEVPGSAHAYNYYNCTDPGLSTDFPTHYLFNAAHVLLDRWARHESPPPHVDRIQVDTNGGTVLDQYGNALGGLRTPWLDVPIATYYPTSTPASTCSLQGHRVPFDPARLKTLYPDHGAYVRPFIAATEHLVAQGFLTRPDADAVINTAASASIPT
jgi:Alpha/beta hydrolase domain